jgi:hypothetical protein
VKVWKAAATYFGIVFGIGFVLGSLRVLWLVPRVGSRSAELYETPLMLLATVLAARWVCRRFVGRGRPSTSLAIGLLALSFLLVAELAVGVGVRGLTPLEVVVNRDPVSGTVYYVSLAVFAAAPWLWSRSRRESADSP